MIDALERDGWEVMTRGWPDILATRRGVVRFIEVKPEDHKGMSKNQKRVAKAFAMAGQTVELIRAPHSGITPQKVLKSHELKRRIGEYVSDDPAGYFSK